MASTLGNLTETGLLQNRLMALAGTRDDSFSIGTDLIVVAQLAARLLASADHTSVTSRHNGAYATVAASSDLAVAVDKAQYQDNAGPCLEALEADYPAAVPDIAATMTWTAFRDTAAELDVRASLSIPLFAGSGRTLAALNLYSHRPSSMAGLTAAAWAAYDPAVAGPWRTDDLDPGCRELAAGLIGARAMRNMIQLAIAVLVSPTDHGTELAYQTLCTRAADAGTSLTDTAALIIEQRQS